MAEENAPNFQIHKIYVKDISFEVPKGAHAFRNEWKPELNVQLNSDFFDIKEDKDHYEVVLTITCDVKCSNEQAFKVEIHQAGVFSISNLTDDQLDHALKSFCPNILYPYAREAVSDVVMKGGFPQLCLSPVNFDMLYQDGLKQGKEKTTVN